MPINWTWIISVATVAGILAGAAMAIWGQKKPIEGEATGDRRKIKGECMDKFHQVEQEMALLKQDFKQIKDDIQGIKDTQKAIDGKLDRIVIALITGNCKRLMDG